MNESSRLRDRRGGGESPVVAQEGPQGVGPAAGQGDDGLDVFAALAALLEVEVPVRSFADDAGLCGHIEHSSKAATVALGAVQIAGAASGVTRDGHQPGRRGEMAGARVGGQVARGDDELGAEYRTHAGQGLDDLSLRMTAERLADLLVDPLDPVVQGQDLGRQVGNDLRGDVLAGQGSLRGLGGIFAVAATASAPRTVRLASQAVSRARPRRRRAAGVW